MNFLFLFIAHGLFLYIGVYCEITILPFNNSLPEGDELTVTCSSNQSYNQCDWYRYGILFNSSLSEENTTLCILNINPLNFIDHNGRWRCFMIFHNETNSSVDFYINVIVPPTDDSIYFSVDNTNYTENESRALVKGEKTVNVTLVSLDTNPLPEIRCRIDDKTPNPLKNASRPFDMFSKIYHKDSPDGLLSSDITLILHYEDYFVNVISVECDISFPTWNENKVMRIFIEQSYPMEKAEIKSDENDLIIFKKRGENLRLECVTDGSTTAKNYSWYFVPNNGAWVLSDYGTLMDMEHYDSILNFTVTYRHQGQYICSASNKIDTSETVKSEPVYLFIEQVPVDPAPLELNHIINNTSTVKIDEQTINGSDEMVIECSTRNGYPATVITWHFNTTPEDISDKVQWRISYKVTREKCDGNLNTVSVLHLNFENSYDYNLHVECVASLGNWSGIRRGDIRRVASTDSSNRKPRISSSFCIIAVLLLILWHLRI